MRHILTAIAVGAMFGPGVSSCSDGDNYNDRILYSSIVTVGSTVVGDGTTFTFQRHDDSPLITLTAPRTVIDGSHVGRRALLYYYPESGDPYASGVITVRSLGIINCDTAIIRPIERYHWDRNAIFLNSIWRTGTYLNLRMRADYSAQPRYFGLVVDSLTLTDPWPEAYVMHDLNGAPENYLKESYASFDISKVWLQPSCRGLRVHVNDSNLPTEIYEFAKN